MKSIFLLIVLLCFSPNSITIAQEKSHLNLPAGVVLDDDRPKETHETIRQAAKDNRVDILYYAMHNNISVPTCFREIDNLARKQRAQLLSQMLVDEKIVLPRDASPPIVPTDEMSRYLRAVSSAYALLGEPAEPLPLLTRAELAALAARLQSLQ